MMMYRQIAGDLLDFVGDSSFEIVQDLIMVRIASFIFMTIFLFLLTHLFKRS